MLRSLIRLAAVGVVAAPLALTHGAPAGAAAFSVTGPGDDVLAVGTLRWAVAQADADATPPVIDLAPGLAIDLTCLGGGALAYDNAGGQPLTINGNGATIRQTCAGEPIMTTDDDVIITNATLTGGALGGIVAEEDVTIDGVILEANTGGAGIVAFTGAVTVRGSIVRDNSGGIGGGIAGIFVVVEDSTISGNSASTGAGVWSDQTASITNSTITGNTATGFGGGVLTTNSDATFVYSTVVENSAATGANVAMLTAGNLTSFASVFAAPLGDVNCSLNPGVGTVTQGSNFTSDATCGLEAGAGDPMLGPLAANGGPTPTRLPAATSLLVDHADCDGSPIVDDQRGTGRPQGGACDIGAVEVVPPAPPEESTTTTQPAPTSVTPDAAPTAPTSRAVVPTAAGSPEELPATGLQSGLLLGIAAVALGAGATITIAARRRA